MNIQFKNATSEKPSNEELKVKSPTYSRSKEERRENVGEMYHDNHLRNISEKIELDNKRSQENVDRQLKVMKEERVEKGEELEMDLERGIEQRDKHLFEISQKGRKDVEHSKAVHDKVKLNREQQKEFQKLDNEINNPSNKQHLPQQ